MNLLLHQDDSRTKLKQEDNIEKSILAARSDIKKLAFIKMNQDQYEYMYEFRWLLILDQQKKLNFSSPSWGGGHLHSKCDLFSPNGQL